MDNSQILLSLLSANGCNLVFVIFIQESVIVKLVYNVSDLIVYALWFVLPLMKRNCTWWWLIKTWKHDIIPKTTVAKKMNKELQFIEDIYKSTTAQSDFAEVFALRDILVEKFD